MCRCLLTRLFAVRVGRVLGAAALLGAFVAPGCLGGQTGTEAAPSTGGNTGTKGETATDGNTVATPTLSPTCPPSIGDAGTESLSDVNESAVVDFVRTSNPIAFRYDDGSSTNATLLIAPAATGCVTPTPSGPSSIGIPVTIQLTSADARVQLSMPGTAVAYAAAAGGIAEVQLTGTMSCTRTADAMSLLPCQVAGVDQSAYDASSVGLAARLQIVGGARQWLGTLRISGVATALCKPSPCSASDWSTVATMTLSSQ